MSDQFSLQGSFSTTPYTGAQASGDPQIESYLNERLSLGNKTSYTIELDANDPVDVSLVGMSNVHILFLRTVGGKVRARVTSADGTDQAFPVDPFLLLIAKSVPITAIDLTRVSGVPTTVKVFLGERPA